MANLLTINNLSKDYLTLSGKIKAIDNITLSINKGDIISIIGPSGCGKSTLLNLISNIDNNYKGIININTNNISYMLQSDSLLPWLSIYDNARLPSKFNKQIDEYYINLLLKKYDLYDFKDKKPNSLSGGMKQRLALIRTLSTRPELLLLDEPFSKLDYQTRLNIEKDVYDLIKENNITTILVTHDIAEAISMSNKVIVLTKRPAKIKNIYNIDLSDDPIKNRSNNNFNYYFNKIWDDLND